MEGLAVYRSLLKNRPLTRLLLGEFISGIGDWLYIVAIFVVMYRESHDAALIGAFGGLRMFPYIFLSVPAGLVADRFDRRLVLLVSDLFRGSTMVAMTLLIVLDGPILLLAGFAILAACGSTFFYPAIGAYIPALVEDERQLGPANSAWASLGNISFIAGPAIGGLLIATGGVETAFILNAASFVVIAVILWNLPPSKPAARAAAAEPTEPAVEAASAAGGSSGPLGLRWGPLAGLGIVQLTAGFLGGGLQVLTIILVVDVLHAGEEANGYLNAAIGVGGLLGAIVSGALVLRRALGIPLLIGAAVTGIGTIALGATEDLLVALIAAGVLSAGSMLIDVISTTVFQRLVPDELRGRAFGVLMTVSTFTGAAGAFVLPVLLAGIGPLPALGGAGVATIILTVLGLLLIGGAATREPTPYEATIAEVAKLALFAGVPSARLETAIRRLQEIPVTAGQAIVRQGEPADRFYIVESGTFTVTQEQAGGEAPVVLRQLGKDQVFGELGLLNQRPRSATVTADTDGVLLALEGREFLRLVGTSAPLRGRLAGLYLGGGS